MHIARKDGRTPLCGTPRGEQIPQPRGYKPTDRICDTCTRVRAQHLARAAKRTKRCVTCGVRKPLEDYYRRSVRAADGRVPRCKSCTKAYRADYENRNRATIANWKIRDAQKRAARFAVRDALASGALKRRPCEQCGAPNAQAHHEDYAKRLDVRWLCALHHAQRHQEIRRGRADAIAS